MTPTAHSKVPLYALALGTFLIGTDAFLLGAVVNDVASDLGVTVPQVGFLVTVFAICYAVFAPVLGVLSGKLPGNLWLSIAIILFALGNGICALGPDYPVVVAGRVVAALGAAGFTPQATAVAGTLGPKENRGRSLAIVAGGLTVATALGVPIGALVGNTLGWRISFGVLALLGLVIAPVIYKFIGTSNTREESSITERLSALKNASVRWVLVATVLAVLSEHIIYTYIEPVLTHHQIPSPFVTLLLLIFGVGALFGNYVGGVMSDKAGTRLAFVSPLILMGLTLSLTSLWSANLFTAAVAMFVWGFAGWMYLVPQQTRLINLSERTGPFTVSLNSSALYLGIGLSGVMGGWVIGGFGIDYLALATIPFALVAILFGLVGHEKTRIGS